MEDARRTVEDAQEVLVEPADADAAFEAKLPKNILKRAVALREILGPCRAARPYSGMTR